MRLVAEGEGGEPLRAVHSRADQREEGGAGTFCCSTAAAAASLAQSSNLQTLLDVLPIGLALVDRDGRFLTMNQAFRQAGGIKGTTMPVYPGDLVVKEDKAAVADAVRRNARGPAMSGDLPVRLAHQPAEPVALTIAGLRGLGDAAVLLLLKDNSEEAKLKRQVAQATKMQVVGQLAGGVAHDFNNILTAIIGHCDLMLMRHTPGDSDYDDIQQIKSNSNRAAGLTRQLLAFSRQQTLRPQVLQLPDVVSRGVAPAEAAARRDGRAGRQARPQPRPGARRPGPARAGDRQSRRQRPRRDGRRRAAERSPSRPIRSRPTRSPSSAPTSCRSPIIARCRSPTPAAASRPTCSARCSSPSSPPRKSARAPAWACRRSTASSSSRAASSSPIRKVGRGHPLRHLSAGPPRGGGRGQAAQASAKAKEDELWGSGTVLLVEDEPMVRSVAERALTRHGYTVITADNGEEALEVLGRGEPIDLLISDVVMPGMDGPTMVREARKSRPDLKILFMSGYAEEQLRNSIDIENVEFPAQALLGHGAGRGGAARGRRQISLCAFASRSLCATA